MPDTLVWRDKCKQKADTACDFIALQMVMMRCKSVINNLTTKLKNNKPILFMSLFPLLNYFLLWVPKA